MQDDKRFVGRIPAFAVTPEMLADPMLLRKSPLFTTAAEIQREAERLKREMESVLFAIGEREEECDCCPCCGCTCCEGL